MEMKPGISTTEYFLTKMAMYFGMALTVVGGVTDVLQMVSGLIPGFTGIGKVLAVLGTLTMVLSKMTYVVTRVGLKKAALAAATTMQDVQLELEKP